MQFNIFKSCITSPAEAIDLYQTADMKLVLPKNPLAYGSVRIEPKTNKSIVDWTESEHKQTFQLINNVISIWKLKDIAGDYMIFGKMAPNQNFAWEIVPYPKTNFRLLTVWRQIVILWRITFGGKTLSHSRQKKLQELYTPDILKKITENKITENKNTHDVGKDKFCDQKTIKNQLICKNTHVTMLHDHAPTTGKGNPHFLIMPTKHAERFEHLSKKQYLEICKFRKTAIEKHKEKSVSVIYMYSNNGSIQGQKHYHEHFIPILTKINEIWGRIKVAIKLLLPFLASKMNQTELSSQINKIKNDYKHLDENPGSAKQVMLS